MVLVSNDHCEMGLKQDIDLLYIYFFIYFGLTKYNYIDNQLLNLNLEILLGIFLSFLEIFF